MMSEADGISWVEKRNGMHIDWDMPIKMSDGSVIRCDVFRPDDEGQYPVLMAAGPYGKWLSFQDEIWGGQWKMLCKQEPEILKLSTNQLQNYEFPDPERFVPDGYVLIRIDVRGTGRSPGLMNLYSSQETKDFYECIEWAGVQPWSNGKVGLNGVSYLAMNQWQVAALRPPHLKAMCIWEGCSDFYREFYRHGGIHCLFGDLWYNKYVLPIQYGLGNRGWKSNINGGWVSGPENLTDEDLKTNRVDWRIVTRQNKYATDEFWTSRLPDFSKIETPLLSSANWGGQGLHLRGNVEGFLKANSKQKWLNFHCLEHWTEFYTSNGIALQKKFFDYFLKDIDNGWGHEPSIQMQVRHPDGKIKTSSATEWPLKNTQWTKLYLNSKDISLTRERKSENNILSFESFSDGLTFLTAPMEREVQIIGPSASKLFISSSTKDADIFLVLRVFTPDLKEVTFSGSNDPHTPMAHGWLRASARKLNTSLSKDYQPYHSFDEEQPIEIGKQYELDIELWPTCITVPKGYRVGLSVRGKDYVYPGDLTAIPNTIGQPATGVGPFRHDDKIDRPESTFKNIISLHFGEASSPYILLPFIADEQLR
jgi:hypothetical protein